MTETVTTAAEASGHFGGAGLDLTSLNLMLEALTDFVDSTSPQAAPALTVSPTVGREP